jgi:putative transposase
VEKLMQESGVSVDHATVNRWVVNYSPQLEATVHCRKGPTLGFRSFDAAQCTVAGVELMHMLKKGQLVGDEGAEGRTPAEQFYTLAA